MQETRLGPKNISNQLTKSIQDLNKDCIIDKENEIKCPLPSKGFSLNQNTMDKWIKVLKELYQSLPKTSSDFPNNK